MNRSTAHSTAYLGLGSNLGDRLGAMRRALAELAAHSAIEVDFAHGVASLYECAPTGPIRDQPDFLNSVVRVSTSLGPQELLAVALGIEDSLGRVRERRWGPRAIDIDLLLFDSVVVNVTDLTVPHPRLHERRFVLDPLCELAGDLVHPVLDEPIASLAGRLVDGPRGERHERVSGPGWYREPRNAS